MLLGNEGAWLEGLRKLLDTFSWTLSDAGPCDRPRTQSFVFSLDILKIAHETNEYVVRTVVERKSLPYPTSINSQSREKDTRRAKKKI